MFTVELSAYAARKVKKFNVLDKRQFAKALDKLEVNPFDLSLGTHRLSGDKKEYYSCRMSYSERILFTIIIIDKVILIVDVGSHDEVH